MLLSRILLLSLAVLAYIYFRRAWRDYQRQRRETRKIESSERMQACATCGTFVPASAAVHRDDRVYCSGEHARAGAEDKV
ncbi:MAG: hypothetical protein H6978_03255 [Gammaproteobacteria bacterium]|nr:hypothetical protein [Gammaproteobacteria bacterium]